MQVHAYQQGNHPPYQDRRHPVKREATGLSFPCS